MWGEAPGVVLGEPDYLGGGPGLDAYNGGAGNDYLWGGAGADILNGDDVPADICTDPEGVTYGPTCEL